MTTRWTLAVAGALALATYAPAVPRAVAQQDAGAARTDTGTGRIAGLVVTDETPPRAVRRALVSLTGDHLRVSRHAITDDEGRFELRDLPPGRYALVAARPAYVSVNYGAAGPRRPGTGLVLRDGEVLTGVRLVLQRGAAIAGLVRDAQGDPVPDVQVGLARRGPDDEWTKTDAVTRTDDRGAYRLWGLPAGDYLVLARLTTAGLGEFRPLSTSAVDRALGELRRGVYGAADLGDRAVSFVPVFYPGVVAAQDASPITLQPGDERDGVDFTLRVVPAAMVDGRVVSEDGRGVPGARVTIAAEGVLGTMQRSTAAGAEGRFRFRDVGPGEYVLAARAGDTRESLRRSAGTSWATTAVVVDGVDVSDVELVLRPGFRIRGMVVFVGGAAEPRPDPTGVRITILARARPQSRRFSATDLVAPATVSAGGWFEVSDLPAGDYWMSAAVPGSQPGSGWRLASIVVNREEVLDRPFRLDPGSAREVEAVVTFEATHTSVSGTLRVGERRVAGDYFVVVFPTDRSRWWPLSRRVQVARPDTAGTFTFVDLAPGEYWLAAVSDLLPNEWEDPQFLEALIPAAVRVTLAEGERRRLDLVAQDARR